MRFSDGFWLLHDGVSADDAAAEAYDITRDEHPDDGEAIAITAPSRVIAGRGDTQRIGTVAVTAPAGRRRAFEVDGSAVTEVPPGAGYGIL